MKMTLCIAFSAALGAWCSGAAAAKQGFDVKENKGGARSAQTPAQKPEQKSSSEQAKKGPKPAGSASQGKKEAPHGMDPQGTEAQGIEAQSAEAGSVAHDLKTLSLEGRRLRDARLVEGDLSAENSEQVRLPRD
jgi:hypothetical protein